MTSTLRRSSFVLYRTKNYFEQSLCSHFLIYAISIKAIEKYIQVLNFLRFSSHFNAIMSSVTGNMADDCVSVEDNKSRTYIAPSSEDIQL
jgi:hypothetical protein